MTSTEPAYINMHIQTKFSLHQKCFVHTSDIYVLHTYIVCKTFDIKNATCTISTTEFNQFFPKLDHSITSKNASPLMSLQIQNPCSPVVFEHFT